MNPPELAESLGARFGDVLVARGEVTVFVEPSGLLEALAGLREDPALGFDTLSDVAATDWPGREPRFRIAYHLYSGTHRHRLRVSCGVTGDDPRVPSVVAMFPTADWLEREVFDFFGVIFEGHPDLRRIELPESWTVYPLRKDHALEGVPTRYTGGAFIPPPDQRET